MLQQVKTRREVELEGQVETFRFANGRQSRTIQSQNTKIDRLKQKIRELIEMSTESVEVATCRAAFILGVAASSIIATLAAIVWNTL